MRNCKNNRHPRVIPRSLNEVKALIYKFTKADDHEGECKVHLYRVTLKRC